MTARYSAITVVAMPTDLNGKEHTLSVLKTLTGNLLWQATDVATLLTGAEAYVNNATTSKRAAYFHFRRISLRCPELNPQKRKLGDFLEVLSESLSSRRN
jgi:hypothetical protein